MGKGTNVDHDFSGQTKMTLDMALVLLEELIPKFNKLVGRVEELERRNDVLERKLEQSGLGFFIGG